MDTLADLIIKHKKKIMVVFIAAALVSVAFFLFVKINYNMVDYLPPEAQSTAALEILQEEFTQAMPNASVMIKNVSIMEAMAYKQKLASVDGVTAVLWLDDIMDLKKPLEKGDASTIERYYKNGTALFAVTIAKGMEQEASAAIRNIIGAENALAGEAPDLAALQQAAITEVLKALAILLPLIILILTLSTTSWVEPLIFLATIGISILINMGTNFFLGEISFITNSVSPILQLAVSLDYAIFLLHSFSDNRKKYADLEEAMRHSIKASMSTIAASAFTTLFGFLALVFMNYQIGADLGLNLAKGIIFSFITVIVFLPALTLCTYRLIDKTKHRPLLPGFQNIHKILSRFAVPVVIMVLVLVVPSFLGQSRTDFIYGKGSEEVNSLNSRDSMAIKEEFGPSTAIALLVPRGNMAKEQELCREIEQLDHVTGVVAYATEVDTTIPPEFLDEEITGQFYSGNYARIVVYTNTPEEGDTA
ncbi:MAG TPA: MMPL family transporter, partial [Bacillota bacterium]|nr:MMPL family transporter [Bacillota bacterium]